MILFSLAEEGNDFIKLKSILATAENSHGRKINSLCTNTFQGQQIHSKVNQYTPISKYLKANCPKQ